MSTKSTDTKTVLIAYHAHCIDGFTSAWACHKGVVETGEAVAERIELLPVSYDDLDEFELVCCDYDIIYVVDFSLPLDVLEAIQESSFPTRVTIIDHHKTAQELYGNRTELYGAEIVMDMEDMF